MRSTAGKKRIIPASGRNAVTHRSDKPKARWVTPVIRVGAVVHHDFAIRRSSGFDELICNTLQRGVELRFAIKAATPRVGNVFGHFSFLRASVVPSN